MEGRRRRKGNAIRQLPYAGRRAGNLCGKRKGRRRRVCRDDPSEEPGAGNPLARICAGAARKGRPYRDPSPIDKPRPTVYYLRVQ